MIGAAGVPLDVLAPELVVSIGLVLVLLADLVPTLVRQRVAPWLGVSACVVAALLTCYSPEGAVASMLSVDHTTQLARWLLLPIGAVVMLAGVGERRHEGSGGAWTASCLGLLLGASLAAAASNFVSWWLGLEILALSSYTLVAFRGGDRRAAEAGMKFVLFGGAASATTLFGISHIYGATGHLDFAGVGAAVAGGMPMSTAVALVLVGVAVAYKLTLVPFHFYAPDVYQGAPALALGAVAVLPKIAVTAALLRFLPAVLPMPTATLTTSLAALAVVSALFAAFTAVVQRDAKRILAFSGIGHGAAVVLAIACGPSHDAHAAAVFYLLTYAPANLGAFLCLHVLERDVGSSALSSLAGAGRQRPWLTAALCGFVLSLAGIPPLAGFLGKWAVLQQAFARGLGAAGTGALGIAALLFLLAAAVAAWSYLLVVRAVLFDSPASPEPSSSPTRSRLPAPLLVAIGVCVVATLGLGIWLGGVVAMRTALAN